MALDLRAANPFDGCQGIERVRAAADDFDQLPVGEYDERRDALLLGDLPPPGAQALESGAIELTKALEAGAALGLERLPVSLDTRLGPVASME